MDNIKIKCPLCGKSHIYPLKIQRTQIMRGISEGNSGVVADAKKSTRLFTCPEKGKMFQASILIK